MARYKKDKNITVKDDKYVISMEITLLDEIIRALIKTKKYIKDDNMAQSGQFKIVKEKISEFERMSNL